MSKSISIGDKVRVLTGKEEGIVRGIQKNIVEVEIEDGFIIPILDKELVVIHREEKEHFHKNEDTSHSSIRPIEGSLFYAFTQDNQNNYSSYLINQTGQPVYFSCYEKSSNKYQLILHGQLDAQSFVILHHWTLSKLPEYWLSWLPLHKMIDEPPKPVLKDIRIKKNWLVQESMPLPLIEKKGKLLNLSEQLQSIEADTLKNAFFEHDKSEVNPSNLPTIDEQIVDLHMEALMEGHDHMSSGDKLAYQLDYFEKRLDAAIVAGVSNMTFIHGVGNGTLKHQIQRKLSGHPHISYFQDAQKEKFGYGALFVKFK